VSLQVIWEEKAVSQAAGFFDDLRGLQEEHGALSAIGRSRGECGGEERAVLGAA